MQMPDIGATVDIVIEIRRGSRVKPRPDGTVEYASPVPVPFNYGAVPGILSGDGDPLDVIVLGDALPVGTRLSLPVRGVVPFTDGGRDDPKLVCSASPLDDTDRRLVRRFFWWFSLGKRWLNAWRGASGPTVAGELVTGQGGDKPG